MKITKKITRYSYIIELEKQELSALLILIDLSRKRYEDLDEYLLGDEPENFELTYLDMKEVLLEANELLRKEVVKIEIYDEDISYIQNIIFSINQFYNIFTKEDFEKSSVDLDIISDKFHRMTNQLRKMKD